MTVLSTAACIAFSVVLPGERRPMTVDDALSMVRVDDVTISPDGRHVFYSERHLDWEHNRYDERFYLVSSEGGVPRPFVGDAGGSAFAFTPDSRSLSFLRDVAGDPQVHLLSLDGGEARPLTDHAGGVEDFQWAADGHRLFFTAEQPLEPDVQQERDDGGDAVFVGEGANGSDAERWTDLWSFDVDDRAERRVTDLPLTIEAFDVNRDGTRVVMAGRSDNRSNYFFRSDLYLVDVEDGRVTRLTDNDAPEERVVFSPDGTRIAYHSPDDAWYDLRNGYLWVMDLDRGESRRLLGQRHGEIDALHWSRDGTRLLFTESRGVHTNLYQLTVETDEVESLTDFEGRVEVHGFSADRRRMVYSREAFDTPPDLYCGGLRGRRAARLTESNAWIERELQLGEATTLRWNSRDGREIEGVLVLPSDREDGARLPLILNIHGGPPGFFGDEFDPEFQVWAGLGYAVFAPNPRGSSSYGDEFLRALMGDVGGGEYDDLMTGVDALIARGIADPDRLALRGWSWGGILGAWTITHTDRFAAASLGAMVGDWFAETGGGLMFDLRLHYIGSEPYADPDEWRARSPLTYVQNVTTPTLLLHGEEDDISTVNQSLMFYTALRDRGVATRFIKFPRQGHDIVEPRLRRICDVEELRWVQQHANRTAWDPGPFVARDEGTTDSFGRIQPDTSWLGDRTLDDTGRFLVEHMQRAGVAGLSAAVIADRRIAWTGSYGWADVEARVPVTADTLFQLASVSKTITSFVVMQLVERDELELDADIDDVLGFRVRNPAHLDVPITLRQLLTHTSSIRDNWDVLEGTWVKNGDFPISLGDSLRAYLLDGGAYFDAEESFHEWAPGARERYSNVGVALAAHLAEVRAGRPFEELCQERVFRPLGMDQSGCRLRELAFAPIAMPYEPSADGLFKALGHHGYLDFPSGCIRTSAPQLARFLLAFVGDGALDGVRILKPETVASMRTVQLPELAPDQGLVWYWDDLAGRRVIGHDGGDPGVATSMTYCPDDGVGVILLMNGDLGRWEEDVIERLYSLGDALRRR